MIALSCDHGMHSKGFLCVLVCVWVFEFVCTFGCLYNAHNVRYLILSVATEGKFLYKEMFLYIVL